MSVTIRPLLLAFALCGLAVQPCAFAQIASPINAGLNSGNNSLGSAGTSAATPNFTLGLPTLSAEKQKELESVLESLLTKPEAEPLAPLLGRSPQGRGVDVASLSLAQGMIPERVGPQSEAQLADLSSQLTASGLEPALAKQLLSLMQSLAQNPNINELSEAITLFNRIIQESNPEELASLRKNPLFVAISTTLRSARTVLGS
jgi:hypothetical protein